MTSSHQMEPEEVSFIDLIEEKRRVQSELFTARQELKRAETEKGEIKLKYKLAYKEREDYWKELQRVKAACDVFEKNSEGAAELYEALLPFAQLPPIDEDFQDETICGQFIEAKHLRKARELCLTKSLPELVTIKKERDKLREILVGLGVFTPETVCQWDELTNLQVERRNNWSSWGKPPVPLQNAVDDAFNVNGWEESVARTVAGATNGTYGGKAWADALAGRWPEGSIQGIVANPFTQPEQAEPGKASTDE